MEFSSPSWSRGLNVAYGLICVFLTTGVLLYPTLGQLTQILILRTALFAFGLARITLGAFAKHLPDTLRVFGIGLGILEIVATAIAIVDQLLFTQMLVQLLSIVMLIHGVNRITIQRICRSFVRYFTQSAFCTGTIDCSSICCGIFARAFISPPSPSSNSWS